LCQHLDVTELSRPYRGASPRERVRERRRRLVDAGVDLFGTIGYGAATIEHICARAGLSKRYFYESFADLEVLLLACYELCANEIHDAMVTAVARAPGTVSAQLRAALVGYFTAIDADQRRARITLLEILGVSRAVDAAYAAQTERFAHSVQALAGETFSKSKLPKPQLHIIAEGIIGAITTIATQWLLDHRRRPRAQIIDATQVLVLAVIDRLSNSPK
jgi:AcrR family transcriptional regulator